VSPNSCRTYQPTNIILNLFFPSSFGERVDLSGKKIRQAALTLVIKSASSGIDEGPEVVVRVLLYDCMRTLVLLGAHLLLFAFGKERGTTGPTLEVPSPEDLLADDGTNDALISPYFT
jgi:hypothetical protein